MKTKSLLLSSLALSLMAIFSAKAQAQNDVVVVDESLTVVDCKDYVSSSWRNNWFMQLGAGINLPYVETTINPDGRADDASHPAALALNLGVGHWFSPYFGFRFNALGGKLKWDTDGASSAKYANLNMDIMWDMFNSIGNVNTKRIFSVVPFVGVGGTYVWDMKSPSLNVSDHKGLRHRTWALPASAGLQLRFRLCKYVDLFAEGRSQFYGDNFNNTVYGKPVDINLSVLGGITINFGGKKFDTVNPCDYLNYINKLNNQVNALRGELAASTAALAACEAQLPCPEVQAVECPEVTETPVLASVRFNINSSKISDKELVNVYNVAEWMKANPDTKLVVNGYADKETGTNEYNLKLSQRRVDSVINKLVEYGVDKDRLVSNAQGDATQPYEGNTSSWNRIVLFDVAK